MQGPPRSCRRLGGQPGTPTSAEILAVALGHRTNVEIPGAGVCETVVIPVDRDEGSKLVLARASYRFSAEESALLRGMGRVLALALRLLRTVAVERRQADENAKLVASLRERQALLGEVVFDPTPDQLEGAAPRSPRRGHGRRCRVLG